MGPCVPVLRCRCPATSLRWPWGCWRAGSLAAGALTLHGRPAAFLGGMRGLATARGHAVGAGALSRAHQTFRIAEALVAGHGSRRACSVPQREGRRRHALPCCAGPGCGASRARWTPPPTSSQRRPATSTRVCAARLPISATALAMACCSSSSARAGGAACLPISAPALATVHAAWHRRTWEAPPACLPIKPLPRPTARCSHTTPSAHVGSAGSHARPSAQTLCVALLLAAEEIAGPYVWGRYDLLLLPPSFPYGVSERASPAPATHRPVIDPCRRRQHSTRARGFCRGLWKGPRRRLCTLCMWCGVRVCAAPLQGMENPCLTFVTPTLLAGDRSLTNVVVSAPAPP